MHRDNWIFDWNEALQKSLQERKPIFLQFHRNQCSGCRKMYALTYPDPKVSEELFQWFIPVRLDILKDRAVRRKYSAIWTPSFYFINYKEELLYWVNGYLNPVDFRTVLRIGLAYTLLPRGKYNEATDILDNKWDELKNSSRASTALFVKGMAYYLMGKDKTRFREIMKQILKEYPDSPEAQQWPWMD